MLDSRYRRIPFRDPLMACRVHADDLDGRARDWFWTRVGMDDVTTRMVADREWLRGLAERVKRRTDTAADRAALSAALLDGGLLWRSRR